MFRKPTQSARQGDRAGVCVTQFDPKLLERGLVCTPGALPALHAAIVHIKKIPYFSGDVTTKSKFHVTVGHSTVMARVLIFGKNDATSNGQLNGKDGPLGDAMDRLQVSPPQFVFTQDYAFYNELSK